MSLRFSVSRTIPDDATVLAVPVLAGRQLAGSPVELDDRFLDARGFEGKPNETLCVPADDGGSVVLVGLGSPDALTIDSFRRAGAHAARQAGTATHMATTLLDAVSGGVDRNAATQALAEGAALATYRYNAHKSSPAPVKLAAVTVVGRGGAGVQRALDRGAVVAGAVALARDLVNEPPGTMRPRDLEALARRLAEDHRDSLSLEVYDEKRAAAEGMGGLLGVAAGSDEPPRLLRLTYEPPNARSTTPTVALVGKGITFDSGGLSLKTGEGMMTMKCDMSGAAAVIAAVSALPDLAPKVRVVALAACSENLPSGKAIKPGDVLKIRNGKTVEVLNTDAEGRLVLADALSLACELRPEAIVDIATLTGAVSTALGREICGVMTNNEALLDQVRAAGERAGEPSWPLPLPKRYRRLIDSAVADMKNIGQPAQAGTIVAGLFLQEFVADVPWAHLDIAGPAFVDSEDAHITRGGTGFGTRTLIELVMGFKAPRSG